ncbi:hypothetical protein CEE44_03510 [Candidatus Woesearchaeota archaeon B3_Woes]|nr:MAG: hypothetical protein CEE44_03510 [Candidatus Woesearchaeota archaeon B3_Woes]
MENGKHLIVNADCNNNLMFNSISSVYELLESLADKLSLIRLTSPYVIKGVENNPGLTGFIIIDTSHISIHSFTKKKFVALDIYSCKGFDHEIVLDFLKQKFASKNFHYSVVER